MADPYGFGGGFGSGWVDPEEEQKKKLLAASPFGLGMAAPAGVAGAGALAGSMMPGGLWGPAEGYSGVAGQPRATTPPGFTPVPAGNPDTARALADLIKPPVALTPAQQAQVENDRGGTPLPAAAGNPNAVSTLLGTAKPGQWYSGWGSPMSNAGSIAGDLAGSPAGATGAAGALPYSNKADDLDRTKQIFFNQQANSPNMGGDMARQLAGAQLGGLQEQMKGEGAERLMQMKNDAAIKEAMLRYSPDAMHGQAFMTLLGSLAGSGRLDAASLQGALQVMPDIRRALGAPGMTGLPGTAGAAIPGGAPPAVAGPQPLSMLDKQAATDRFFSTNAKLLPAEMQVGGGVDPHGKPIPGAKGGVEKFDTEKAADLWKAIGSSGMRPEVQKEVLTKLFSSPAGAQVRDSMLSLAAQDETNALDMSKIPRDPEGRWPGIMPIAGTPFTMKRSDRTRVGDATQTLGDAAYRTGPWDQAINNLTGQTHPVELAEGRSGRFNPFTPNQAQLNREREQRRSLYGPLYDLMTPGK